MKETALYSAYKRLEKSGDIESFKSDNPINSRRTYYMIIDIGKKYYFTKVKEWDLTKDLIKNFISR